MDLEQIFEENYNAYSEIKQGRNVEQMPTMNKDKFVEVVRKLVKSDLLHSVSCCPKCGNPYTHLHRDGSRSCEDCNNGWG